MQNVPIYVDVVEEFRRLAEANVPMYPVSAAVDLGLYSGHRKPTEWVPPEMPPAVDVREENWLAVYKTSASMDINFAREKVRKYAPWLASVLGNGAYLCKQGDYRLWHTERFEAVRVVRATWHTSYRVDTTTTVPQAIVAYVHPPGHYEGDAPVHTYSVRLPGVELYGNKQRACMTCGKTVSKYLGVQHQLLCLPCARKLLLDLRTIIDQFDNEVP